jgi:hypothetical protein
MTSTSLLTAYNESSFYPQLMIHRLWIVGGDHSLGHIVALGEDKAYTTICHSVPSSRTLGREQGTYDLLLLSAFMTQPI